MGKTALVTCIAYNAAYAHLTSNGEEGGKVAFFSLEMSHDQLASRILSQACHVKSDGMRKGDLTGPELEKMALCRQTLSEMPLYIDDTSGLTMGALRARARRIQRQYGLDLLIVDYLQLINGGKGGAQNRVNEISEISRGLKMLAKELNIPVIALSQLSRTVETREDKRPQLSDLRDSGSIEQDADAVMFVYRDAYYVERAEPTKRDGESFEKYSQRQQLWEQHLDDVRNQAELIVAKQRHGPLSTLKLFFNGEYTLFGDFFYND